MKKGVLWLSLLHVVFLLIACAGGATHAPVVERLANGKVKDADHHRVAGGETLFTIAWRYGLDYKKLASINKIKPPYMIQPGQNLALRWPVAGQKVVPKNGRQMKKNSSKVRDAGSVGKKESARLVKKRPREQTKSTWHWPAKGKLLSGFSNRGKVNKGIDIRGRMGDAVYSTKSGTVVYAGNGLAGYGNLIILKHNESYLSAYAHNRRVFVKEGQRVQAGVKIAELGSSGVKSPMLHFEIRHEGKPVNPLTLLPSRK